MYRLGQSCSDVQIFEGESIFHYPQTPSANVEVPLVLKRDAAVSVSIKVQHITTNDDSQTSLHITGKHICLYCCHMQSAVRAIGLFQQMQSCCLDQQCFGGADAGHGGQARREHIPCL